MGETSFAQGLAKGNALERDRPSEKAWNDPRVYTSRIRRDVFFRTPVMLMIYPRTEIRKRYVTRFRYDFQTSRANYTFSPVLVSANSRPRSRTRDKSTRPRVVICRRANIRENHMRQAEKFVRFHGILFDNFFTRRAMNATSVQILGWQSLFLEREKIIFHRFNMITS
jgi:hypothetical protein